MSDTYSKKKCQIHIQRKNVRYVFKEKTSDMYLKKSQIRIQRKCLSIY